MVGARLEAQLKPLLIQRAGKANRRVARPDRDVTNESVAGVRDVPGAVMWDSAQ